MAGRAIWKGVLQLESLETPVKLYAAVEDRKIHFHVLQSKTKSRVKQQMVGDTGEAVERENIRKGYEVEPGTYVVLEDEELDRLKPEESRKIEVTRFVPPAQLGNEWFERPYYLGPDGDESKYFALVEALQTRDVVGILRWTMRGKAYIGALMTESDYLLLIKTRYSEEVLPADALLPPEGPALDPKELRMAEELISALEGKFNPAEFRDEYRERVRAYVQAKAKGKHPSLPSIQERSTGGSLDDQLARSLATLKRRREKNVA